MSLKTFMDICTN